jgi:protein SCO1/2
VLWSIVAVLAIAFFALRFGALVGSKAPPPLLELPAYKLTDHRGQAFGAAELRGKVYIADFVFTSCPTVCPRLTERMREIQKRTDDLGERLQLVTFSVDPENDTPEVLAAYAKKNEASPSRWTFLTGPLGEVETVVLRGFKIAMGKTQTQAGILEIFHGERLVLVDREGKIRRFYEASDQGIEEIIRDARLLVAER